MHASVTCSHAAGRNDFRVARDLTEVRVARWGSDGSRRGLCGRGRHRRRFVGSGRVSGLAADRKERA
jgi:hypothetical protein